MNFFNFFSKSVIDGVKSGQSKDETMILCTIYRVSLSVHIYAP